MRAAAYTVPLQAPQSDGTVSWDHTTMVMVEARAKSTGGLGYSYGSPAAASVVHHIPRPEDVGVDAFDVAERGAQCAGRGTT